MKKSWKSDFEYLGELGQGGNTKVYHVISKDKNEEFALKELQNKKDKEKQSRFSAEVDISKKYSSSIPGIIPVIKLCEKDYWYTMPIATGILEHIIYEPIKDIVRGVIQLSETLIKLHEDGVSHRDIKPSNIYFYENRYSFGDFGLVDFPDNPNDFTKSNRGVGAIFTIAPEMKRNPKHSDGKKADVFSLAKTLWMLLTEENKGFDGEYNFLDSSHSIRDNSQYINTHLVEIDELIKDSTNNNPDLRPTIKEFNKRLINWMIIYKDGSKTQASEWNFLSKQLLGPNPPESSVWRNSDKIVEVLNIVGKTPVFNHMLFSDQGGLDFSHSELANEEGCINVYDTLGNCHVVKPKSLSYEGFNENYRWNYFLLELDKLAPVFNESNFVDYERLVEDKPGNYVTAKYFQYGVYDYDTGESFPEGYKLVYRYMRGKFLIVIKNGPYNRITGTYDGRHGLSNNSDFRTYIEKLINLYSDGYAIVKNNEEFKKISEDEIELRILSLDEFNKNPFKQSLDNDYNEDEVNRKYIEEKKSKDYINNNYSSWSFESQLEPEENLSPKINFYFVFTPPNSNMSYNFLGEPVQCICKDGYIKELNPTLDSQCFYTGDRKKAIALKDKFHKTTNDILLREGLLELDEYENCISIKLIKRNKPEHLFTKDEIKNEIQKADDRYHNQLIIDENGYAKVLNNDGYGHLFPVRHETWNAGNVYVGKYSNLNALDDDYISSLHGWLSYLKTGQSVYVDYVQNNINEEKLLNKIAEYY